MPIRAKLAGSGTAFEKRCSKPKTPALSVLSTAQTRMFFVTQISFCAGNTAESLIGLLEARLDKLELSLQVTDDALDKLAEAGFDPVYGARPLKRAIQNEIENPLARAILAGKYPPKSAIVVDVKDGDIVFA